MVVTQVKKMAKPQNPSVKLFSASLQAVGQNGAKHNAISMCFVPETDEEKALHPQGVYATVYARAMDVCKEEYPPQDGWHSHSVSLAPYVPPN